jgi:MFS family permease
MENNETPQSLWKNRVFTKMFASYSISSFGDWFDMTALLILFSYIWHADPFLIALVPISYAIPSILLGQLAGVYADRMKKLPLMILSDLVRAGLTVLLVFVSEPYWALLILLLRSTASIVHAPAQQALLTSIVDKQHLLRASTMFGMMLQISKVAGPLIGSVLISLLSVKICLVINVVSFFISAVLLMSVGRVSEDSLPLQAEASANSGLLKSWAEGWKTMFSIRLLYMSFLFFLVGFFSLQMVDSQFGVLLRDIVPDQEVVLGYVISFVGFGTFTVGGILTSKKDLKAYAWTLAGGCVLTGAAFAGFGFLQQGSSVVLIYALAYLGGIGVGSTLIGFNFLRQKETPQEMMGRITGITNSMTSVMVIMGPMVGSLLIHSMGVASAFQVAGCVMAGVGVLGLLLKRWIWDNGSLGGVR